MMLTEVLATRFHEVDDPCDVLLLTWAAWMREPDDPEGYPRASMGFENPGYFRSVETLYDDAEEANRRTTAEAADAVINGLPPAQTCAIWHEYGFCAVFRFRDYQTTLDAARAAFLAGMRKRGF